MKKRLEAELMSIAHRILKLKNKSELLQLYTETRKLYETLSVLKFVEENMGIVQPKMDIAEIEEKLSAAFDNEIETAEIEKPISNSVVIVAANNEIEADLVADVEPEKNIEVVEEIKTVVVEIEKETEVVEPEIEPVFEPLFEMTKDEILVKEDKGGPRQISFQDLLGHDYNSLTFEKVSDKKLEIAAPITELENVKLEENQKQEELENIQPENIISEAEDLDEILESSEEPIIEIFEEKPFIKPIASNTIHAKTITFGLNDRIGFEKNLFGGSGEDMNRVISQISTFDTFEEAQNFIDDMVKPDYNNWDKKDDYALRFMEIVEKSFV